MPSIETSFLRRGTSVPLLILLVAVICLLGVIAASAQTRTVYCGSDDNRRHTCQTDTRGGVRLLEQKSHDACVQGRTWGYSRDSIWVDRGCRADFEVGERRSDRDRDRDANRDRDRDREREGDRDRGRNQHGSVTWTGKVDHDVKLVVFGSRLDVYTLSGKTYDSGRYSFSGTMPRDVTVTVRRIRGRNEMYVEEQPSRRNDYKASIRIKDGRGGSDQCEVVISW